MNDDNRQIMQTKSTARISKRKVFYRSPDNKINQFTPILMYSKKQYKMTNTYLKFPINSNRMLP